MLILLIYNCKLGVYIMEIDMRVNEGVNEGVCKEVSLAVVNKQIVIRHEQH